MIRHFIFYSKSLKSDVHFILMYKSIQLLHFYWKFINVNFAICKKSISFIKYTGEKLDSPTQVVPNILKKFSN